jgi:hypothetical protein
MRMNCLEAKSAADELRKSRTMPIQKYAEGEEINGLLILQAIFNRVPWMFSYKVSPLPTDR